MCGPVITCSLLTCGLVLCGITLLLSDVTMGAPQNRNQKAGPCIGMDCLHGVMMHGDSEQGDDHKGEDTYNRLQREDINRQTREKPGPCEGDDCLHSLMHNEKDMKNVHHNKMGPELEQKPGVEEGMEFLHGVLMHGDGEPGLSHKLEDADKRKKEASHEPDGPCLDCLQGRLHSTHLDLDRGEEDETEHREEQAQTPGIFDPDQMLHPDGSDHSQQPDDSKEVKEDGERPKPLVFDPDKLLHADGETHDDHMEQKPAEKVYPKSGTYDPESALHGKEAKGIHDTREEEDSIHNGEQGKPGTYNPDALLHGGDQHAHDKEQETVAKVELGKITDQHEHDDFKRWMAEKIRKGEAKEKEGGVLGFSQPYISDTVLDDIEQMKQRYVLKDWGQEEMLSEEGESSEEEEGGDEEDSEEDWEWEEEEVLVDDLSEDEDIEELVGEEFEEELLELREVLMADDDSQPCIDCDEGKDHAHKEEMAFKKINVHDRTSREYAESLENDMRHELENIGNTKPLRSDVDIMMDNEGRRVKRERDNGL